MWKQSENGFIGEFPSRSGKMLSVELNRKRELAILKGETEHVLMGMRDNKVKIFNDLYFESHVNNQIKERMGQLFIKKADPRANKRR